jgi:multiple sugar transport system ATP-binding protein
MASISIEGASRTFADGTRALDGVNLVVGNGELLVLVGPSGCGKSTLLRSVAGLEPLDSGRVLIGEADVTGKPAGERDIAMVFQNYALYPQMTVRDNIEFGLKSRRMSERERRERVADVAGLLGLGSLLARRPAELSGGQLQRVAMGRAIARRPQAFLMDEPLSNLDAQLRTSMRAELSRMRERLAVTTLYVTHDQIEAMTLGERVAVMREGTIQQCDTPRRLFDRPRNVFVATFMGSPPMNLLKGTVTAGGVRFGRYEVNLESFEALTNVGQVTLSGKEARLMALFVRHRGETLARADILEEVWGMDASPTERTVDNVVVRLRRYFEPDPENPTYIVSVRGQGYRFNG